MNEQRTATERVNEGRIGGVHERSRSLRGGLDPVELGRRSGEARREKAAQREALAELDKLTVRSRAAAVLARKLDAEALMDVTEAAILRAKGDGQTANQAGRLVLDLLRFASDLPEGDGDNPEGKQPEDMTPAERAALRAQLAREAEALARSLRAGANVQGSRESSTRETT